MGGEIEPAILAALSGRAWRVALQGNCMLGWRDNGIDTRTNKEGTPFVGDRSKGDRIHVHNHIHSLVYASRSHNAGTQAASSCKDAFACCTIMLRAVSPDFQDFSPVFVSYFLYPDGWVLLFF